MKASQDASDCVLIIKNACFLLINIYSFCEYSIFFKHEIFLVKKQEEMFLFILCWMQCPLSYCTEQSFAIQLPW